VFPTPVGDHLLSRYDDCLAVLRDPRWSADSRHLPGWEQFAMFMDGVGLHALRRLRERSMLFLDPPDHTRLRKLVSQAFTPRAIAALRPRVEAVVDDCLDAAAAAGELEAVSGLAYPVPLVVICELLGVPAADHDIFAEWSEAAVRLLDPGDDLEPLQAANAAVENFEGYFNELFAQRRQHPGDDLLSALLQAEDAGDRLSNQELMSMVVLLLIAGHETTVNLIGSGVLLLLRHPDQLARLRDDPALGASTVEECLRFESPVQITGRYATTDLDVNGHHFEKGASAVTLLGAANRDPRQFPGADGFDIGRSANQHLALSSGSHYCLGASLARLETDVSLTRLVARFPTLELAAPPVRRATINLRGMAELRVTVA
jgi:cytochrome P450